MLVPLKPLNRRLLVSLMLAVGFLTLASPRAQAAPGALDLTFGTGGKVTTSVSTGYNYSHDAILQPDGKIIVAGDGEEGWVLARHLANGGLDTTFGTDGTVTTTVKTNMRCYGLSLQSDGKIVAAGTCHGALSDFSESIVVARYLADGSLDPAFGSGGVVTTNFSNSTDDGAQGVVVQPDGKIVVAGQSRYTFSSESQIILVRYLSSGQLDPTFGSGGKVPRFIPPLEKDSANAITLQTDGKIVVVGRRVGSVYSDCLIRRYHTDGSPDATFGSGGTVVVSASSTNDYAHRVVVQDDGKILVAGEGYTGPPRSLIAFRLHPNGSLDSGFGTQGIASTPFGPLTSTFRGLAVQSDGRIVVGGLSQNSGFTETPHNDFCLIRLTSAGVMDTTFGTSGRVNLDFALKDDHVSTILLQKNGAIIAAGPASDAIGQMRLTLARFANTLAPGISELAATTITEQGATLSASVNANEQVGGGSTAVTFGFSANGVDFTPLTATPDSVTGINGVVVIADVIGLTPGSTYHFRVKATSVSGTTTSSVKTFKTPPLNTNANLADLAVVVEFTDPTLSPAFSPDQDSYTLTVPYFHSVLPVLATAADPNATVTVNGKVGGMAPLVVGENVIQIKVTAEDGVTQKTYTLTTTRERAPSGSIDEGFNTTGYVILSSSGFDGGSSVVVQPDGKVVIAGHTGTESESDFALWRFQADGTADTTFGTGGKATISIGSHQDLAVSVALQNDGKLVIAGLTYNGANNDLAVVRCHADGSLDSTFGTGGKVIAAVGTGNESGGRVALQSDGKILVGGSSETATGYRFVVLRYQSNGSLDTTFDSDGIVTTEFGTASHCTNLLIQPDGKILATGHSETNDNADFAAVRYHPNGALDITFGTGGKVITAVGGGDDISTSSALQEDGKILLAGATHNGVNFDLGLVRYHLDGTLDISFGTGGKVTTHSDTGPLYGSSVAVQKDGRILIGAHGGANSYLLVRRYLSDGTLDSELPAFTPYQNSQSQGLALQKDGKILLTGFTTSGSTRSLVVTRYHNFIPPSTNASLAGLTLSSGTLNPAFASDQLAYSLTVPYAVSSLTLNPALAQADATVKINGGANPVVPLVVGDNVIQMIVTADDGLTTKTYTITVTRATAGDLDLSFNTTGIVTASLGLGTDSAQDMALQNDGKIVVIGMVWNTTARRQDFGVARFLANGTLDTTFGTGGKVVTPIGTKHAYPEGVALQSDGKILVTGSIQNAANNSDVALVRYNANGSLDAGFGTGGKVITTFGTGNEGGQSVAVQTDGKIVVAGGRANGVNDYDFALLRYNADGTLDSTFGTGGKVTSTIGESQNVHVVTYVHGLVIQPDGKLVVTGICLNNSNYSDFAVVRYLANGNLDTSFGAGGKVLTNINGSSDDRPCGIVLQSDGKIVVAGNSFGAENDFVLVRYTVSGELDSSFGTGGKVITNTGANSNDSAYGLALQDDGKILLSGLTFLNGALGTQAVLLRYRPNGSLDPTFGVDGKITTPMPGDFDRLQAVAVQGDGNIVAVGGGGHISGFMLVRYAAGAPPAAEITVRSPIHLPIYDGGNYSFGTVGVGGHKNLTFTVSNAGVASLTNLSVTLESTDPDLFSVVTQPVASLSQGGATTFTVRYSATAQGNHGAVIHLASSDADESSFDIILTGNTSEASALPLKILPATLVTFESATLNGTVQTMNADPLLTFEYGLTTSYGSTVSGALGVMGASTLSPVSAGITGLLPNTKYYYRLRDAGSQGPGVSPGGTFTTKNRPPVAVNDTYALLPGAVVPLNVLANDFDLHGDTLSLLSYTAVPAAKGTLAKVNGALVFTAAKTFDGAAFNYVVKDQFGGTATGAVTLTLGQAAITPENKTLVSAGGVYDVAVTTAFAWKVTETLPWVSVSPLSGNATGTVQITLLPNPAKAARTGTVTIAGQPHPITQQGVLVPAISPPELRTLRVSGSYELPIPTVNAPVTYVASNLPPGLTINQAKGAIVGRPSTAGNYAVTITARNAAGPAPAPATFDLEVLAIPEGAAGVFHGLIARHATFNGQLGSRFEMTVTNTGAVTGKFITGVTAQAFKGTLDTRDPGYDHPEFHVVIDRPKAAPLQLDLIFDAPVETAAGTLAQAGSGSIAIQAWRSGPTTASDPVGTNSFFLTPPSAQPEVPQGFGFGTFTIADKTGLVKISGKLPDGSALLTTTFLGPQGQVLVYHPLYANKGSFAGVLTVANNHTVTGAPTWYKPAVSSDTVYPLGFGPVEFSAAGRFLPVTAPGDLILNLPAAEGNALLDFSLGGLDAEGKAFDIPFTLSNPAVKGLTNKATFPQTNLNKVTLQPISIKTGAFSGDFTIPGATAAKHRKVTYQGQIVLHGDTLEAYGYFLLPEPWTSPVTLSTSPKRSGRVVLRAKNP